MSDNQILYANINGICFFKFIGEVRHEISGGLDNLIQQLFEGKTDACKDVVVDLTDTTYLDSTNLGLLAIIARTMLKHHQQKATLVSTNEDLTTLLQSMCLDQAFNIVDHALDKQGTLEELSDATPDDRQRSRMILAAHEELILLDDRNKSAFQPVVDLLRQELQLRDDIKN